MKDKNIGFIGLGNLGTKLANSILQANYNLFIYDLNKNSSIELVSKGAFWQNNIKDVLLNSTVVITCLPSPQSIIDVIEKSGEFITNISNKHLWIEISTTDEVDIIRLSKLIELRCNSEDILFS